MASKLILFIFLLVQMQIGFAHPPGLSSTDITVKPDGLDIKITFAIQDIEAFVTMDTDGDAEVTDAELNAATRPIAHYVTQAFKILADGQEIKSIATNKVSFDKQNNAIVELTALSKPSTSIGVVSKLLSKLPPDHKQYVTVKDVRMEKKWARNY